jgi:hypothetical protein
MIFRVLWTDAEGMGRFHDVVADSEAAAAFRVASDQDSPAITFEGVLSIDVPAVQELMHSRGKQERT